MFLDTLSPGARQLLTQLGQEPFMRPFYLAGGSAAALHIGHRASEDLDFFTQDPYETEPLAQQLQTLGKLDIQQQSRGTLVGQLQGVRLGFFAYPYPLLTGLSTLQGIQIAGLLDIALMKLIAVSQRGARRDFVDLYFICQRTYPLEELLRRAPDKYRTVSYPAYQLLRALTYFVDAEQEEPPRMRVAFDWTQAKRFFEEQVKRLMQTL